MPISKVYNKDCMEVMANYPDKYFDIAIVDPPYGDGQNFNFRFGIGKQVYQSIRPNKNYFDQLFRVSINQIIWGGNYFTDMIPVNRCWIAWVKNNPAPNFSDFELAWTSFKKINKIINLTSYGFNHADKRETGQKTIHPTQKPIELYRILMKRFCKNGDKILDTHLGSGSSRIAAYELGFDFWGIEINEPHFNDSVTRFENQTRSSQQLIRPLSEVVI